jgi:hypothetical protein
MIDDMATAVWFTPDPERTETELMCTISQRETPQANAAVDVMDRPGAIPQQSKRQFCHMVSSGRIAAARHA